MKKLLLALLLACLPSIALAQSSALVVSNCGTVPLAFAVGSTSLLTIDQNGQLCGGSPGAPQVPGYPQGSTTAAQLGPLVQGAVTTSTPIYTTGQTDPFSLTTGGLLRVGLFGNTNGSIASAAGAAANGIRVAVATDANVGVQPYPWSTTAGVQAAPIIGVGTGSTGAVVGTLAGVSAKTTYICGFDVSATGGVASLGPITITGLTGGTFTYQLFSTATGAQLQKTFTPCIPASAVNTAIVITTTADGTATAVDVNSWGFQL